jgi:hypothetical protein
VGVQKLRCLHSNGYEIYQILDVMNNLNFVEMYIFSIWNSGSELYGNVIVKSQVQYFNNSVIVKSVQIVAARSPALK